MKVQDDVIVEINLLIGGLKRPNSLNNV